MKLKHKEPCRDCPWLKTSAPGWLGDNAPEVYADVVQANGLPECHRTISKRAKAICVGALATSANSCTQVRTIPGGEAAKDELTQEVKEACFKLPSDFYQHHAGKPYVHPFARAAFGLHHEN